MAVGDFTINSNVVSLGNATQYTGTVECDTNNTTSAIFNTSCPIISFSLDYNADDDDAVVSRVAVNASDFSATEAVGSVHIQASAGAPDTWHWTAVVLGTV